MTDGPRPWRPQPEPDWCLLTGPHFSCVTSPRKPRVAEDDAQSVIGAMGSGRFGEPAVLTTPEGSRGASS